ncbi:hypothetical protein D1914_22135 [Salmonella enterica]|nr:hypothetical protein [Salmonella enterica]EAV0891520.1 hypothetical protein [Salmonella enterica]EBL1739463.1 hypothetical protein [Salmonella enterica]
MFCTQKRFCLIDRTGLSFFLTQNLRILDGQPLRFYNTSKKLFMHSFLIMFSFCKFQDIFSIKMENFSIK